MIYTETLYLVDTNTLSNIGRDRRKTPFFLSHTKLLSEILREAETSPDISALRQLELKTTPTVLRSLIEVMATVESDDTSLVDLYRNQGGADPILVASSLAAQKEAGAALLDVRWIIVTDDKAVQKKASEFGLSCIASASFIELIDAHSR